MLAVGVLLFGKLVHQGQECGGCCTSSECHVVEQQPQGSEPPCPFGCEHHSQPRLQTAANEPCDSESPDGHDEHTCAVCSVLSHVTQSPDLVGLPAESELVAANACVIESMVTADVLFPAHPRGPPLVG